MTSFPGAGGGHTERETLLAAEPARGPSRTRYWILKDVQDERERQDRKWGGVPGVERRDDHTYAAVLTEEVGEACKAWLEREPMDLRAELIQVAAVAMAWVEELDNGGMETRP